MLTARLSSGNGTDLIPSSHQFTHARLFILPQLYSQQTHTHNNLINIINRARRAHAKKQGVNKQFKMPFIIFSTLWSSYIILFVWILGIVCILLYCFQHAKHVFKPTAGITVLLLCALIQCVGFFSLIPSSPVMLRYCCDFSRRRTILITRIIYPKSECET